MEAEKVKRSIFFIVSIGTGWFLLVNILFLFGLAELVSLYANTVATGQEAIDLDRALSKKLGGTVMVVFLILSALFCARWSVSGFLPGTSRYKK